jgi:hypothetical protein
MTAHLSKSLQWGIEMKLFYSKSTGGFYSDAVHSSVPDDAVEITSETHREMMDAQSNGSRIASDAQGRPIIASVTPAIALAVLATAARNKRNALLTQSDWTQVADAPVDTQAWATYRQALRDITDQAGFPENIDWPVSP